MHKNKAELITSIPLFCYLFFLGSTGISGCGSGSLLSQLDSDFAGGVFGFFGDEEFSNELPLCVSGF
jgi:hypothetical protein